jgi:gamma-glutamylcyclotransferase (GGCT)/AIG2-like uncharacterized protein YtfP
VKILDTNLWVFGTLRTNEQSAELLAKIDRGLSTSAINTYKPAEISHLKALGRSRRRRT